MRTKQKLGSAAAGPGPAGTGASKSVQLNFKNHCLFCLGRQTPQQIYEVVKLNPKNIKNFQPVISYLTGTDPTTGRRDRECKTKNIPMMGNLPPMCELCYKVLAELYRLHVELLKLQVLIQAQTLKGRRIIEKSGKTTGILKRLTSRAKFYKTLKEEGMSNEQFDTVMEFVENLHNLINLQGQNEVKYPAYPDVFNGEPRKLPIPATTALRIQPQLPRTIVPTPSQNNQNPSSEAASPHPPSGVLIPVQLIPTSTATPSSSSPSINLSQSVSQPMISTDTCPMWVESSRPVLSSTPSNTGTVSNHHSMVEEIDLCDDSDDEIKSEKEEEGRIWEEANREEDDYHHPLNDPLYSPEHIHEDDEEETKIPVETGKDQEQDDEKDMKSGELTSGVSELGESERIQSPHTSTTTSSLPEVQSVPMQQPSGMQTVTVAFTSLLSVGSPGSFQLLPVVTTTQIPVFGPLTNVPEPPASTNVDVVDKPKPKRVRKRVRKRKPREKKPKFKKVSKNRAFIQRCDMCNVVLERYDMKAHVKSHLGKDGFTCFDCNRTFATKRSFFFHVHHGKSEVGRTCDLERRKHMPEFFSSSCIICDEHIPVKMESFRLRQFYVHLFSVHEKDTSLEELYECILCGSKFRTENGLDFHLNEHLHERRKRMMASVTCVADLRIGIPETRRYLTPKPRRLKRESKTIECSDCPRDSRKHFDKQELLDEHIKLEHQCRHCKLCDYSCKRFDTYMYHLKNIHLSSYKPCDICFTGEGSDVQFENLTALRAHYFTAHGIGKELTCDICDKKFLSNMSLSTHSRMVHKVISLKQLKRQHLEAAAAAGDDFKKKVKIVQIKEHKPMEKRPNKEKDDKNKVFQCEYCLQGHHDSRFVHTDRPYSKVELEAHMDKHHPRKCQSCDSDFLTLSALKEHEIKEHPELHPQLDCPKCFRTVDGPDKLKIHLAAHLNPYRFSCPICSRKFKTYTTLYNHKFVHSKDRPHICHQCGRGFRQKRFLAAHLPTHKA